MKKLSKPILTLLLIGILTLSTATISFASDLSDPTGFCMPRIELVR
jgi:hypothetical protein